MSPQFSTPTQGLLGGIGIAISATLLLYSTGRALGVSGFIHRSVRSSPLSAIARQGDIVSVLGLLAGGVCVGALETSHDGPGGGRYGTAAIGTGGGSPFSQLAPFALAGLLSGFGTKCANGCTSGHMVCGLSRFSRRSMVSTLVFFSVASLTTQFRRQSLPPIEGYDWSLGPIGLPLLKIQGALVPATILLLITIPRIKNLSHRGVFFLNGLTSFLSTLTFAFALRLSTLNMPEKVSSFLITPIPDPKLFDTTLAFLALGSLPIAAVLYYAGTRLQAVPASPRKHVSGGDLPSRTGLVEPERDPLIPPKQTRVPFQPPLPVLDGCVWPSTSDAALNRKLILGSILFGVGWGMLGLCPGPAVLNFGSSLYSLARGEPSPWFAKGGIWLFTFVVGGLVAP